MPLFYNRIKEQILFLDSQKTKMVIFSIFSNMLLNIDSISNAIFTQYYQSNSRKIQIDNVDITEAFCKAMFLLSYSFITSWISRVYF